MSSIKKHQNTRLWNGPAAITRDRPLAIRFFIPEVANETKAAGMQTVKEKPAEIIGKDSLDKEMWLLVPSKMMNMYHLLSGGDCMSEFMHDLGHKYCQHDDRKVAKRYCYTGDL